MMIREPAVAGMFYARDPARCRAELEQCLDRARARAAEHETPVPSDRILGGIVPHAGWMCSGSVAGRVFSEIAQRSKPAVVVVFGAVHVPYFRLASVFPSGAWETPLGLAPVEGRLAERICGQIGLLYSDPQAHEREHSIEVEVPFIQHLLPDAMIVPIMVRPEADSAKLGQAVGRACRSYGVDAAFLASTDLTHYGPGYGFTPQGVGPAGLKWAKEINDRRMIDLILALKEDAAVAEAQANRNACGGGAIAATIAACKAYGARRATLLEHTNSHEVLSEFYDEPMRDAVGYAAIVFHE